MGQGIYVHIKHIKWNKIHNTKPYIDNCHLCTNTLFRYKSVCKPIFFYSQLTNTIWIFLKTLSYENTDITKHVIDGHQMLVHVRFTRRVLEN
ncbi:hypothetical protein XELAEV_18006568mg [Xenopus laevis]|uniref:Uncharacterized protein n=1 Tax=Xenopus laevis TaxID=8355 RepID=A0A974I3M6_XENLA|nr:hypothetical protein XELAEV_18006568mg [Xenopus laevis]